MVAFSVRKFHFFELSPSLPFPRKLLVDLTCLSIGKPDQYSPHIIGTAGNEVWSSGEWSLTLQPETGDPISLKGHWSEIYVRDGDAWKVRMQSWNITPAPPAETK
jgi:hypothetical protein